MLPYKASLCYKIGGFYHDYYQTEQKNNKAIAYLETALQGANKLEKVAVEHIHLLLAHLYFRQGAYALSEMYFRKIDRHYIEGFDYVYAPLAVPLCSIQEKIAHVLPVSFIQLGSYVTNPNVTCGLALLIIVKILYYQWIFEFFGQKRKEKSIFRGTMFRAPFRSTEEVKSLSHCQ